HADQPAAILRHEVDGIRGHPVRGHEEIALVLAILVVDHDQDAAGAHLRHCLLDGRECPFVGRHRPPPWSRRKRCTYLPIMSISKVPCLAGLSCPSVVWASVCGITMISNACSSSAATVRLTPSTAIEP